MESVAAAANSQALTDNFVGLAFGGGTPKKAVMTAFVVGTILTVINHGDTILVGEWPPAWKIMLTYCVPYCVTTWGAIIGKRTQLLGKFGGRP
jgi:hypothetical protein